MFLKVKLPFFVAAAVSSTLTGYLLLGSKDAGLRTGIQGLNGILVGLGIGAFYNSGFFNDSVIPILPAVVMSFVGGVMST